MNFYMASLDRNISAWMNQHCHYLMRVSLALIFIWFGMLKPLGMSPEEELIKRTEFFSPPDICFNSIPFALTLERQYIIKNIFLIGAAFVIGSKVSENG